MKYLSEYSTGDRVAGIYFVKEKSELISVKGKPYHSIKIQDKTGIIDGKIWDVTNGGIAEYDSGDYIDIIGEMKQFNNAPQISIQRVRKAYDTEYNLEDYIPSSSKTRESMWNEFLEIKESIKNKYLHALLDSFFVEDEEIIKKFYNHSAAKAMHHAFLGGLLEHTLSVAKLCDTISKKYINIDRDLLITGAMLHDIGKTVELTPFPKNDYSDEGQLLGHILIGCEMIHDRVKKIDKFPPILETQIKHLLLSHHGEYEYGSPKKPAIIEALALNLADNLDAKMEMFLEILGDNQKKNGESMWLGFNKAFDSHIRRTSIQNE